EAHTAQKLLLKRISALGTGIWGKGMFGRGAASGSSHQFLCPKFPKKPLPSLRQRHQLHLLMMNVHPLPCPQRQVGQQSAQLALVRGKILCQRSDDEASARVVKRHTMVAEA